MGNGETPERKPVKTIWVSVISFVAGVIVATVVLIAGGGAIFNPCATAAVPAQGLPVPAGAVDQNGAAVPPGAQCTPGIGDTCTAPGAGCGIFGWWTCTDTWNNRTGRCDCMCQ